MHIYPVILSGGSGTRLWPLSQPEKPKQFVPVVTDRSMIQETITRFSGWSEFVAPIIVAGEGHFQLVKDQLAQIGVEPAAILLEPGARNTAAAVGIAARWIADKDPQALMMVMPSDHVINDLDGFRAAIERAARAAKAGYLVTFGIQPTHPETGYGYIERGPALVDIDAVHHVENFHEKPAFSLAKGYAESGRHYWNGGMFLFSAANYLAALKEHAPAVDAACAGAMEKSASDGQAVRPDATAFLAGPDISIDHAVMEKAANSAVVPVDMGWSDVGSWDALWAIIGHDGAGNGVKGDGLVLDASGNMIFVGDGPPVATLGIRDCIIVSTAASVLVIPKSRAQDVKSVATQWLSHRSAADATS